MANEKKPKRSECSDLAAKVERMRSTLKEKKLATPRSTMPKKMKDAAPTQVQLAFDWPELVKAMPTELTRTALFALIRRGQRKKMDESLIPSRSDVEVRFTGEQLDQADADVWLLCLHLAKGKPFGEKIFMNRSEFLRLLGRSNKGKSNYEWLDRSMKRLSKAFIEVVKKEQDGKLRKHRMGMLKDGIDETSNSMYFYIDPNGGALFQNMAWIPWEQRLHLSTNTAKAVQIYASGHKAGEKHSVTLANLAAWTGHTGRLRDFRDSLEEALKELEKVGMFEKGSSGISGVTKNVIVFWKRKKIDQQELIDRILPS